MENMVNIRHGIMELELMSKWIIQYGSIRVTNGGINKTGFMFQQKHIVHSWRYHKNYSEIMSNVMHMYLPFTEIGNTTLEQTMNACVSAIVLVPL